MKILNSKPVATIAAACALSLVSAAAFAAGGSRGGGAPAGDTMRASASSMHGAGTATMRPSAPAMGKPTTATAKTTTTAHTTGQPGDTCLSANAPTPPGNAASAPGSAFNPDGKAGTVYAGQQPQNSKNPNSVSQYDVACARPTH